MRWRTILTFEWWAGRGTATSTSWSTLRSIRFEVIVRFANFVHLFEAHRAEDSGKQFHRRIALRLTHLLQANAPARHESGWKVRPTCSLRRVVERIKYLLPLLRTQRRQEGIGGANDLRAWRSLLRSGR